MKINLVKLEEVPTPTPSTCPLFLDMNFLAKPALKLYDDSLTT